MGIKVGGFDDLQRKLKKLTKDLKKIEGTRELSLEQLLPPEFISRHSQFSSVQELFNAGPFNIESQDDFENLDPAEMDRFIDSNTDFSGWEEMKARAGEKYFANMVNID